MLVWIAGWPLPDRWPTSQQWQLWLEQPLTEPFLAGLFACLGWLIWLLILWAVTIEIVRQVRSADLSRVPFVLPLPKALTGLIGTAVIAVNGDAALAAQSPPASAVSTVEASTDRLNTQAAAMLNQTTSANTQTMSATRSVGIVTLHVGDCAYEYQVNRGDSLWRIAEECLGDAHRWPEIWKLNKGKYWTAVSGRTKFTNPDLIFPGWVLTLPADAVPPPDAKQVDPPADTPDPPLWEGPEPSPDPAPTPGTGEDPDGVVEPPTVALPTGSIHIPGGWIGAGFAAGLLVAAATLWRRRRHRYLPTPITSPVLDDGDLTPPMGALTHIRQTLRRNAPALLTEPDPGPTMRQYAQATIKPDLPPVGPSGAQLAGAGDLPTSAGMGLTGPAAHHAARGILVATLTAGHRQDPDAHAEVIIAATTLTTLLDGSDADLPPMRRLTITASLGDALTHIEQEIIRRARILAEYDVPDIAALREPTNAAEALPQLLLIADTPDIAWHRRLATTIRLGSSVDIAAVMLGSWPPGTTLAVADDGTTTGGDGQRLAVLDTTATTQALAMLAEAHGDTTPAMPSVRPTPTPTQPETETDRQHRPAMPERSSPAGHEAISPPAAGGSVTVRVLGVPAILGASGDPARGLRAKSLELLVYLVVHRSGAALPDIMEAIWPDATMRRATERLSTCVANLRTVIRTNLSTPAATESVGNKTQRPEPVINTGGRYHLNPDIVDVDWWHVLDAYARVATAGDDTVRLTHLQAGITAAAGGRELAADSDYDWIDTDRESARRHLIRMYAQAADLVADTDPQQANSLSDAACELDPLNEELARRAMTAAARLGDTHAIRHRLAALRRELTATDIDVDITTEQLASKLLAELAHQRPA